MLATTSGNFVIVWANPAAPQYYWKGVVLPEVIEMVSHLDADTQHIKLRVLNTSTYDAIYVEMNAAGIATKKVSS